MDTVFFLVVCVPVFWLLMFFWFSLIGGDN